MQKLINNANMLLSKIGLTLSKQRFAKSRYPNVEEILDDDMVFKKETIQALMNFKESNPYKGTLSEVQDKFRSLNSELSKIYKLEEPKLMFCKKFTKGSCYFPYGNIIIIQQSGKSYGVITYLHEFRHAMGAINEHHTCKWSINLFKKVFPEAYEKLEPVGHMMFKKSTAKKIKTASEKVLEF